MFNKLFALLHKPLPQLSILLIYSLCSFGIYWPSITNGFNSDDFVWLDLLNNGPGPFLNFNDRFFLPLAHIIQYLFIAFSQENPVALHVMQLILHIANAFLLFKVVLIWRNKISLKPNARFRPVAFLSGLFFCTNPYNAEAVNWFASISYPLSTLFILIAAIFATKAMNGKHSLFIMLSALFYLLSMLCKEISIPIILILILAISMRYISSRKIGMRLLIAYFVSLSLYCSLRFFALDSIVGGYGSNVHVFMSMQSILIALAAYFLKFFLFYRYLFADGLISENLKQIVLLVLGFILLGFLISFLLKYRMNAATKLKAPFFLFLTFIICCLPVLSLEITSLGSLQSDRYGYFPCIAFSILLGSFVSLLNKPINFIMGLSIMSLFVMSGIETNMVYRDNDRLIKTITADFDRIHIDNNPVVMINIPDNYNGVYTFRHGFENAMQRINPTQKTDIEIIAWQNISENSRINIELNNKMIEVKAPLSDFCHINPNITQGKVLIQNEVAHFIFYPELRKDLQIMYFNNGHLHDVNLNP